jgi:hypothetical protein
MHVISERKALSFELMFNIGHEVNMPKKETQTKSGQVNDTVT